MFNDLQFNAKYQISPKKSIDLLCMKSTDSILSFMQKAIKNGKPENYDCYIYSKHLSFWGFCVDQSHFYKLDPKYTFDQYMLTDTSPQFVLVEKTKSTKVFPIEFSYNGSALDPYLIAKLNIFSVDTIRAIFTNNLSLDQVSERIESSFENKIPIIEFESNIVIPNDNSSSIILEYGSNTSIPNENSSFIILEYGSIIVFQNDRAVFYASLVSIVYYAIPNNDSIVIVFRNGNGFVYISFKVLKQEINQIVDHIHNILNSYITKNISKDDKSEIQFCLNRFRNSKIHNSKEENFHINPNRVEKDLPIDWRMAYAIHPQSQHLFFIKNGSAYYQNADGRNSEKIFPDSLGDINGIKVNSNRKVFMYSRQNFVLYDKYFQLQLKSSYKVDYGFCCADISNTGDNIVISSHNSTVRFYNGQDFFKSRINLQLFHRSIKIHYINISHDNKWVLITSSYSLIIVCCEYKDKTLFDTFPKNHEAPCYLFTFPLSLLNDLNNNKCDSHFSQSQFLSISNKLYIIASFSNYFICWKAFPPQPVPDGDPPPPPQPMELRFLFHYNVEFEIKKFLIYNEPSDQSIQILFVNDENDKIIDFCINNNSN